MSRCVVTQYSDDLDGTHLTEEQVNIIRFAFEGKEYVIDLGDENARRFREDIGRYIAVASRFIPTSATARGQKVDSIQREYARKVRRWAQENGKMTATRGKIPQHIYDEYAAATGNNA